MSLCRGATIGPSSDTIKRMSEATIAGLERVLETTKAVREALGCGPTSPLGRLDLATAARVPRH